MQPQSTLPSRGWMPAPLAGEGSSDLIAILDGGPYATMAIQLGLQTIPGPADDEDEEDDEDDATGDGDGNIEPDADEGYDDEDDEDDDEEPWQVRTGRPPTAGGARVRFRAS